MAVYVDPLTGCVPNHRWRWSQACHLYADTIEELHQFADHLGLRRSWFQHKPGHYRLPHYDLTPGMRRRAVQSGAVEQTRRVAVALWRELRWAVPAPEG